MDAAAMISILDDHGFSDTLTARKVEALQSSIDEICAREAWPFLEKQNTSFALPQNADPTMPADFRAVVSLVIPSNGQIIVPERLDTITKSYPAALNTPGIPQWYYFVSNQLKTIPVADQAYTAVLTYICTHPAITSTSAETDFLIPPRHHKAIVFGALVQLYNMEDDAEIGAGFAAERDRLVAIMEGDVWMKQFDRTDRIVDLWDDTPYGAWGF